MTKPIPPLYTPTLVDTPTKTHLLEVLAAYGSAGIMQGTLDDVFLALLTKCYPLQDVLPYLYDGPVPPEWYTTPRRFDHRGLCLWFWNSYITAFSQMPRPARPRLPDGTQPFVGQAPDDQLVSTSPNSRSWRRFIPGLPSLRSGYRSATSIGIGRMSLSTRINWQCGNREMKRAYPFISQA